MSRLADPSICPDCRAALDGTGTCTGCDLRLTGPLAAELWQTMLAADGLVERLRVQEPAPAAALPKAPPLPPTPPRARTLPSASVPVVLFTVGGLCLFVAAVVFVAVAWSSFGLGTRAAILSAVTLGVGAVAVRLTRRGLRGAAETLWALVAALVTVDLTAAYNAGLLGYDALESRHAAAVLGGSLVALGLGVASWGRRTELGELVVPALTTAAGTLLVSAAEAWTASSPALPTTISVVALAALTGTAAALGLRRTTVTVGAVAVLGWAVLLVLGLDRLDGTTPATWYGDLHGWPLLAAAALAGTATVIPRVPDVGRLVAAGAAEVTLVLFVLGPGSNADTELLVAAGVVTALAAAAVLLARTWSLPATVLTVLGFVAATGYLLARPLGLLSDLPTTAPADAANLGYRLPELLITGPSSWTAILVAAVVVVAGLALGSLLPDPDARLTALRTATVLGPAVLALGVVTALLETGPILAVAVGAWAIVLAVLGLGAATVRGAWAPAAIALAGYLVVVGLRLAVPSHLLAALLAAAVAAGLALATARTRGAVERAVLSAGVVLTAGFAATHAVYPLGGQGDAAGVALALVAAVAGVLAARVCRGAAERITVELTALVTGFAAATFPVHDATVTVVLTIVGTAVALVAVLERDRDQIAWFGAAVLGLAALLRVDADLALPELATAPAAALLLVAGVRRMLADTEVSSIRALGSGLTLALLPSLLIVLDEPVSVRAALLGCAAVAALAAGIGRHWAAPFLAGSGTLAVLAVRQLGPVVEGLPRWISLGTVGVVLLAVAVTWESRRRELRTAERYLAALR
ncbi:SCO7613 C-terminal domain-containing membrane protein [Marmoricola sp. RAF53]|uniref:SCO7613 C-terminal domain-containing membrane protein n=1 Tax=Marmoricola sp. RAF53 TaxID=3233059 RepID=UPI003F9873D9